GLSFRPGTPSPFSVSAVTLFRLLPRRASSRVSPCRSARLCAIAAPLALYQGPSPMPTLVMKNVIGCCCVVLCGADCCADARYEPKSAVAAKTQTTNGTLVIRTASDYFWKAERPINKHWSSHQL